MSERNQNQENSRPTNIFVLTPRHIGEVIVLDTRDLQNPEIKTIRLSRILTDNVIDEILDGERELTKNLIIDGEGIQEILTQTSDYKLRQTLLRIPKELNGEPHNFSLETIPVEYLNLLKDDELQQMFAVAQEAKVLPQLKNAIETAKKRGEVIGKEVSSVIWQNPQSQINSDN